MAFEDYEVANLVDGVEKFNGQPQRWRKILMTYNFNPRRTSVDLKDKWRNIVKNTSNNRPEILYSHKKVPWTNKEVKVLKKGYAEYGDKKNPWATILDAYRSQFNIVRTSTHLKDKWRNIKRKEERRLKEAEKEQGGVKEGEDKDVDEKDLKEEDGVPQPDGAAEPVEEQAM